MLLLLDHLVGTSDGATPLTISPFLFGKACSCCLALALVTMAFCMKARGQSASSASRRVPIAGARTQVFVAAEVLIFSGRHACSNSAENGSLCDRTIQSRQSSCNWLDVCAAYLFPGPPRKVIERDPPSAADGLLNSR